LNEIHDNCYSVVAAVRKREGEKKMKEEKE
jgi:hypothetical protein